MIELMLLTGICFGMGWQLSNENRSSLNYARYRRLMHLRVDLWN